MNKPYVRAIAALGCLAFLLAPVAAVAGVTTSIDGFSNGSLLFGWKATNTINRQITDSASGGTIKEAKNRAIFEKYRVRIGNKVVSTGTAGDEQLTHTRSGSIFFGKAKFIANKPGASVKNFKILYHMDGRLRCKTPDDSVPEGYSLARVETQVGFNGKTVFAGTGTVDGQVGFDGGGLNLAGKFSGSGHEVSIDRNFKLNLGTLKDGKKYPMLFFGATTVSYASDVPISYCEANFQKTSSFTVADDEVKKKGKLEIKPATQVGVSYSPRPWPLTTLPDVTVYLEHKNSALLKAIDINTVQLFTRLGDSGNLQPKSMGEVSDVDSDGIPDRGIVFEGTKFYLLLDFVILGYTKTRTIYIIAETTAGQPLAGMTSFTAE